MVWSDAQSAKIWRKCNEFCFIIQKETGQQQQFEFGLISSPGIKETELALEKFRKSSTYFSLALSLRKMLSVGHIWGHEDHMWQLVWGHQPDDNITSCKNSSGMYDSVIFNFMSVDTCSWNELKTSYPSYYTMTIFRSCSPRYRTIIL